MVNSITMDQMLAEPRYLLLSDEMSMPRGSSLATTYRMIPDARRDMNHPRLFVADLIQMTVAEDRAHIFGRYVNEGWWIKTVGPVTIANFSERLERLGLSFGTTIEDRPSSDKEFYKSVVQARNATARDIIADLCGVLARKDHGAFQVGSSDAEDINVALRQEMAELYKLAGKQVGNVDLLKVEHPFAVRELMVERLKMARKTLDVALPQKTL